MLPGNVSGNESNVASTSSNLHDDEVNRWYFSREEIEQNSPSRRDGIDLKMETRLRKSYFTFLNCLGVKLKIPQLTIATAIVFCHRFFLRQSHAKNDRMTIATICMFLAGKVKEDPLALEDVIVGSYELLYKKNLTAAQRKEVYEQRKELVLSGEQLVLSTLNFDLIILHPHKPLLEAIKKYKAKEAKAMFPQVAWSFADDCLRTSLCLQYKPRQIAAGVFFLTAERLTMDLQSYGEGLCQDFDITPLQLDDIRGQILELYEKRHIPASQGNIVERNPPEDVVHQSVSRDMASTDNCTNSDIEGGSSKVNLIQSNDHSVKNERSRPEGIIKDKSESKAGENRDDHCVHSVTGEKNDDVGVSQLEKDLQLRPEEVKANGEKDNTSLDKDLTEREVEDVELRSDDDKTMQKRSESFMKVEDSDRT